jgi:hypothetical protein
VRRRYGDENFVTDAMVAPGASPFANLSRENSRRLLPSATTTRQEACKPSPLQPRSETHRGAHGTNRTPHRPAHRGVGLRRRRSLERATRNTKCNTTLLEPLRVYVCRADGSDDFLGCPEDRVEFALLALEACFACSGNSLQLGYERGEQVPELSQPIARRRGR